MSGTAHGAIARSRIVSITTCPIRRTLAALVNHRQLPSHTRDSNRRSHESEAQQFWHNLCFGTQNTVGWLYSSCYYYRGCYCSSVSVSPRHSQRPQFQYLVSQVKVKNLPLASQSMRLHHQNSGVMLGDIFTGSNHLDPRGFDDDPPSVSLSLSPVYVQHNHHRRGCLTKLGFNPNTAGSTNHAHLTRTSSNKKRLRDYGACP